MMVKAPVSVYVTAPLHPEAHIRLAEGVHLDVGEEDFPPAEIRRRVANVEVILSKTDPIPIDADIIDAAPRLRLIARHGSGYNNVDIEHATRKGIPVTNTPGAHAISIAEYTVGLMIAAARKFMPATLACHNGAPDRLSFMGMELHGKTCGVVGAGQIGRRVVHLAHSMGMRVLVHHPRPSASQLVNLPSTLVDLDTLLRDSDVISLHVPLNDETRNLIGSREFALMKSRSVLVNMARGGVVDEMALHEALTRNPDFSVATDVLAEEPVTPDEPLLHLPNCLVMPHIAAVTDDAQRAVANAVVSEVLRYARGEPLHHIVNPNYVEHERLGV